MAFADCQFLYDKTESQEITAVASVKPTFNLLTGNSMKSLDIVSLSFRYCDVQFLNRKPEQYEVFYKKASGDEEEDCMEGAQSFNVTACVSLQEIVLPDLDPMAQYSVCMRIRTSVGASKLSDVRWRKPLKHPGGVDAVLVGGLSTVSIIVFLLILTFVIWRCYLKYENMDAKIELPSVDTDHQSIVETSKSRQASNGDSGFDSQYVSPHTSEEKKRSMQYRTASPQLQSEGSFEDIDKITGNHQSQVSGNKNRTGVTTKRLTEPEPDCSYTGHKINQTCLRASCATNSTTNTNKNSCADCYWIASGFHDRDSGECFLEGDEKEPFIKTDEYSKALSLIPTDLQNSKDANSTVVLDRSSYSYKKQLDMEVILSVGDSENEACNYSDHSDSTLYSDLSKDDLDQIASLEDLLSEETVTRHENKSFTGVNSNHINPGNYGHSQLRSNSDNPSERTSLVKSHKPFAVSLETSCTEESRYGTNSNPSHIQDDNSEKERLLAYLQSDDKVEHTYSDPDNDFSIAHSGTYCEPEKHLSGTYCEPEKHLSGTGCEPHKHHSGTYCKPDKDISDTCCEPYKDYSGTGCEPHKDLSGTRCESDNDISDTCFEPHKDHPGTCSEPHGDQFDICYEVDGDNCDTNIVPHEDQFNTMSCCELRKEQSGICREPSREKYCMCFGPKPLHTTNSLRNCEQHVPYKTLDDNRKTKVKSKGYVKKIC
ncbi:hypothetical protein KP79_PYT00432 [Mizuhopecten yessoensis]|uniref:Uncharacterized protein n=2 Tax=Mizuhopecten yessoensis TaxID=6573 RepID=A0A210QY13_MIZYE|nr:hypothetical protein KP79_PYT00432 [Mizuhopecten yessoensis]